MNSTNKENRDELVNESENTETVNAVASAKTEKKENSKVAEQQKIIDEQNKKIDGLTAQIETLMKMMMGSVGGNMQNTNALDQVITVVHLIENANGFSTHIQLSNLTMDFHTFLEERVVDRRQAEELVGKYRYLFDEGVLAFAAKDSEISTKLGVKSVKDYSYLNKNFIDKLATCSLAELEDLFNAVDNGHKEFIVGYFKRKIIDGDRNFMDVRKVEALNRLSDGAMKETVYELTEALKRK